MESRGNRVEEDRVRSRAQQNHRQDGMSNELEQKQRIGESVRNPMRHNVASRHTSTITLLDFCDDRVSLSPLVRSSHCLGVLDKSYYQQEIKPKHHE